MTYNIQLKIILAEEEWLGWYDSLFSVVTSRGVLLLRRTLATEATVTATAAKLSKSADSECCVASAATERQF
jgi:hypothetical protein